MKVIVGITGASGAQYAVALLRNLQKSGVKVVLIVSEHGKELIHYETTHSLEEIKKLADEVYDNTALDAPVSSGSQKYEAFIIVPCSLSTLSKIACGIADNLITRTASVSLKEKRKLILVPRETPLSAIQLENMQKLATLGTVIMPAMPGFYHKPKSVDDLVDFIIGKILEQLGIEHNLYEEWDPKK